MSRCGSICGDRYCPFSDSLKAGGNAMAVRVLELHHHGVRVPLAKVEETNRFYTQVLGLQPDVTRPEIPNVPGSWMYVGQEGKPTAQIHIMGTTGAPPPWAKSSLQDPTRFHVALAV